MTAKSHSIQQTLMTTNLSLVAMVDKETLDFMAKKNVSSLVPVKNSNMLL